MSKKSKAEKRKAKLRARKQQIALSEQSLSTRLSCALEKLCEPVMPEYIDDSNGPDLVGRRIVWRMGQIAWNIVVTGRRTLPTAPLPEVNLMMNSRSWSGKKSPDLFSEK